MHSNIVTSRLPNVVGPVAKQRFAQLRDGALHSIKMALVPAVLMVSIGAAMAQSATQHDRAPSNDRCWSTSAQPYTPNC